MFFKISISLFVVLFAVKVFSETVSTGKDKESTGTSYSVANYGMHSDCSGFIQSNGEPGEWGVALLDAINKFGKECFYNKADFSLLCPKYKKFSETKKTQFLLTLFAALADDESTCRPKARAPAENGIAIGLFQLEEDVADRKAADRDPLCFQNVKLTSNAFQMGCAVGTFATNYCDTRDSGATLCAVAGGCGYWQELKKTKGAVSKMAKKFPGCK